MVKSVGRKGVFVDKLKKELRATMKKEENQEKQKEEKKHVEKLPIRMEEELVIKKKLEIQKRSYETGGEIRKGKIAEVDYYKI